MKLAHRKSVSKHLPDFREPVITLQGSRRLLLENIQGIITYESEELWIRSHKRKIHVLGKNLKILYYTEEEMEITGTIDSVDFDQL